MKHEEPKESFDRDGDPHEVHPDKHPSDSATKDASSDYKGCLAAAMSPSLRPFVIISVSYLLFTITDGAIRMIVLLHAYNKSFSALQVAIMFTLYELAGVFTNLLAGIMGATWGIKWTLLSGLVLQIISYASLFGWKDEWSQSTAIIYVTVAQMFAGIAKDLTKLGGKTVTKLVTPDDKSTQLFKLVSLLTGWKNSLKGVGYFLGSALLQISYEAALISMMALVFLAIPWALTGLDKNLGTAKSSNATWKDVFTFDNHNLNWLSFARLFLFASRDFWFEVPLPFFLRSPSCDGLGYDSCLVDADCGDGAICDVASAVCANINVGGGCGGPALSRVVVGSFLGGYIILYGQIQSWTPQLVTGPLNQTPPNKITEVFWGTINCIPTLVGAYVFQYSSLNENGLLGWLIAIIVSFAVIFAINSSIHSFLVVHYAKKEKVAVSVGFYYMSNAMGRLFGTIGSGLLYTYVGEEVTAFSGNNAVAGLAACFFAGTCCSLLAAFITLKIEDNKAGLKCGSWTLVDAEEDDGEEEMIEKVTKIPEPSYSQEFETTGDQAKVESV
jgi:hypothetical protein